MTKTRHLTALLATLALLLDSTAPALGAPASPSTKTKPRPRLTVECSFTGPTGELCRLATEEWASAHGVDVKIERKVMTSTEKLAKFTQLLEAQSDKLDVFGLDVIWPGVLHKHLMDLEPAFRDSQKNFLPAYIENNTVNGRLLAVPFYLSFGMMFYRKDLLDKYGLKVPETWAQLEEASLKIQNGERAAGNDKFWGFVFQGKAYEGLTCNALEWVGSYGGSSILTARTVTVNNANMLKALNMAASWVGRIAPREVLGFAESESHKYFRDGNAAFLRAWPSAWEVVTGEGSPVANKVGIMQVPRGGEKGSHVSVLGGYSLAVSKYSKQPELAVDLVKYLSSVTEQKRRALKAGHPPTLVSLYSDPEVLRTAPYNGIALSVLSNTVLRPAHITRAVYPEVSKEFWTAVHRVLEGKDSALQGISKLQASLEKLSVRWRK